ncbi:hypothetical protein ACO0LF_15855 [Undibacterium sp. Di27W]|uniref:hypothetical protein n=1 Tax=Undibacterium sp. Di27W TaxID=3413036 RepID=UPI003BF05515
MIATSDYTLSDSHFFQPRIVATAEYKDRPKFGLPQHITQRISNSFVTNSAVFFFVATKTANSISDSLMVWANNGEPLAAIKFQQEIEKIKLLDILKMKINTPGVSSDIDSLSETVESAFEIISRFGPGAIVLNEFQRNHVNGEHLASLLRVTYHYRFNIDGWNDAFELAVNALKNEGIDAQDALAGML